MAYVGAVYDIHVVKVALLFLGLLCQNVAVVSVMSFNLTRSGERETLFCSGISLYFWHFVGIFIGLNAAAAYTEHGAQVF